MKLLLLLITFGSDTLFLSLNQATELLLKNNYLILASECQVRAAEAQRNQAFSAFLPQVKLDGNYRRVSLVQEMKSFQVDSLVMIRPGVFIPVGHTVNIPFGQKDNYQVNLGISQPIFTWGILLRTYQMSVLNLKDKMLSDTITRNQLVFQIKQLYTYGLILREFVNLSRKVDEELLEHYETTKRKYNLGTATEIELLQAESKYKNNKFQILEAERQYQEIIDMMKVLLNLNPNVTLVLTDSLYLDENYINGLVESSFNEQTRYDIKSLGLKLQIVELSRKNAASSNLPNLFYSFNYLMQKPFGFENIWKDYWALTVGISLSIFDGLKGSSQFRELGFQKKALEYSLAFQKNSATMEFERARRNLLSAIKKYEVQSENLKIAEKLYYTVKTQYEQGLATQLDYISAETNYFAQRAYLIQALGDCVIKAIELEKTIMGIK
ncbi:MAG: TolC family protein [candidate division WOR-3 bacterium]